MAGLRFVVTTQDVRARKRLPTTPLLPVFQHAVTDVRLLKVLAFVTLQVTESGKAGITL